MRFSRLCTRRIVYLAALAAISSLPALCQGQTSGSWVVDSDGSWSAALNWNPSIPGSGGVATFGLLADSTAAHAVAFDTAVTLGTITFDTPFAFSISGGNTLTLNGPAAISAIDGPAGSINLLSIGHQLDMPIAGNSGLNKTGNASVLLTGSNTFTGAVNISGGAIVVTDNNNSQLGGIANVLQLSNGAALVNISTDPQANPQPTFVSARNITLGAGGGELRNLADMSLSGAISGAGNLTKRFSNGSLSLSGNNTYTGQTFIRDNGTIRLNGLNGAVASSSQINLNGRLILDNTTAANSNRVGSVPILSNGGAIQMIGNSAGNVDETIGAIALNSGMSVINLVGSAQGTRLLASALTRANRSTAFIRGDKLGAASGATFTNLLTTAAPTLVGAGGAAGATSISIVPWLIGNAASGNALNEVGNTFVTYSAANGFRPLDPLTEYATALSAGAGANVRLNAVTTNNSPVTINSLILAGFDLSGSGTISLGSGAVAVVATGGTYSAPLNFGANEAIFHTTSSGTFSGIISGSAGLTKSGVNALTLSGANTFTGPTAIVAGQLRIGADVLNDGVTPGPLGISTTAIEMYGGAGIGLPRLYATLNNNVTIARNLTINNASPDCIAAIGTSVGGNPGSTFTYTGNITVNGGILRFEGDPASPMIFNGTIWGAGAITDAFGSSQVLSGNNNFTGGTTIQAGTYLAGSNSAFGTGSIVFSNTAAASTGNPLPGAIGAFGAPRTISNPILVAAPSINGAGSLLPGMAITGSQALTLAGPIDLGGQQRVITVANSADTIFSGVISRGGIEKQGAGRLILSGNNTYTGNTVVQSGTLSFGRGESNTALIVNNTARAEALPGGDKILVLRSLSLAGGATPTATLDLYDNDLKLSSGSSAGITAQIAYARNGGAWDRAGLTSTSAASNPNANTTLGVLSGEEYRSIYGASAMFDNFAVGSSDVVVKYTYYGDTDLNGVVGFDDYSRIDLGFNTGQTGWLNGDFDFSGTINFDDYALIDRAYNTQTGTLERAIAVLEGNFNSTQDLESGVAMVLNHSQQFGSAYVSAFVPEPSAGLYVFGVAIVLGRVRGRKISKKSYCVI